MYNSLVFTAGGMMSFLLVAADVVCRLALDEIEAVEDGAARYEEAPNLIWKD